MPIQWFFFQMSDLFKDTLVFANDDDVLEEILNRSSVIDWSRYLCVGTNIPHIEIFRAVASVKGVPCNKLATCHLMILEDMSKLPSVDRYYLHTRTHSIIA